MYSLIKLLHLVAAIVWMGGMTFMIFALKPSLAGLQPSVRAPLMAHIWQRFFAIVLASIVLLFATGTHLYTAGFRAAKLAGGTAGVPIGQTVMLALGMLMFLIFGHIYFAGFKKFKRAVADAQWPVAGAAAALIQKMVLLNFVLGWIAIAAVRLAV
jgi:uncharacterized membrane protein